MARRRRTATRVRIVRSAPRSAAPIVIRQSAGPPRRRFHRARRAVGAIGAGGAVGFAIGGALYGFAVKSGWIDKLPAIPIVGRTGTAAIALDFWARRGGGDMVRKAANAAAVLAGYQLTTQGHITGLESMGDLQSSGMDEGDW
jgi:hypothetical protein